MSDIADRLAEHAKTLTVAARLRRQAARIAALETGWEDFYCVHSTKRLCHCWVRLGNGVECPFAPEQEG